MNPRQFLKVKVLRQSLDRLIGRSPGQDSPITGSISVDQPPVIRSPEQRWNAFVGVGVVSLAASVCALAATVSYSHPSNVEKTTELVTNVAIKILMGAAALGFTVSTFAKRKGVGMLVFTSSATLCILTFSAFLIGAVVTAKNRKSADRTWAANSTQGIDKLIEQAKAGTPGDGAFIAPTGDKDNDDISSAVNYLASEMLGIVVGMNSEIGALKVTPVFNDEILKSADVLEAEAQKRIQALQIIERHRKLAMALPANMDSHIAGMGLSADSAHGVAEGIRNVFKVKLPMISSVFDMLAKKEQAELDYLHFMAAWFGQYSVQDHNITFASDDNTGQYTALVKAISDATDALRASAAANEEATQEGKDKISEMGK